MRRNILAQNTEANMILSENETNQERAEIVDSCYYCQTK